MSRQRRYLLIGFAPFILLALPFIIAFVNREMQYAASERELQSAIAELDQIDPNWRWEDLEALRPSVGDSENLVLQVKAMGRFSRGLGMHPNGREMLFDSEPKINELRPQDEIELLSNHLQNYRQPLDIARKVYQFEKSRLRIPLAANPYNTPNPYPQDLRQVWQLLDLDTELALFQNDLKRAINNIQGILNSTYSLHDELLAIPHLVRMAGEGIGCGKIERLLALSEPKDRLHQLLPILQKLTQENHFLHAIRGERAFTHKFFEYIEKNPHELHDVGLARTFLGEGGQKEPLDVSHYRAYLKEDHATYLRSITFVLDQFRKPIHQQVQWVRGYQPPQRPDEIFLTPLMLSSLLRLTESEQRSRTQLEITRVAIAVELFRVQHGRWPKDLSEIPKEWLASIPSDPYDGKPIRYRIHPQGAIVYSVGPDGFDHQGDLGEEMSTRMRDHYTFRLWNPEHRRKVVPVRPELLPYPLEMTEEAIKP